MTSPYAQSWDVSSDIHPTFRTLVSNVPGDDNARTILVNAIVRALDMPQGTLPDAPERGYDLKRLVLLELDPNQLDAEAQLIADECEREERVVSAEADVEQERTAGGIRATIAIRITPDFAGPFEFTISAAEAAGKIEIQTNVL